MLFIKNFILCILFLLIDKTLAVSYNQPKFCSNPSWNPNATIVANMSTIDSSPYAIFINTNNTIYVTNQNNGKILTWSEGNLTSIRNISANFSNSSSLFINSFGSIYIDTFHSHGGVSKITLNSTIRISRMNPCQQCWDIFINQNNILYCSLTERHQIIAKLLDNDLNPLTIVAGTGTAGSTSLMLHNPHGIFVNINSDLYVADCGNNRIQLFPFGKLTARTIVGNGSINNTFLLNCPTDIILDGDEYLYIIDSGNNRIIQSGLTDSRCIAGCINSTGSQLLNPWALSFDSYGNIFVTNHGYNRIDKFSFISDSCKMITISEPSSFWSFDNHTLDSLSIFHGTPINSPTYKFPGIDGYGSALSFNPTNSQYVNIPTYRNLTYRSFTVEMWFYCTVLTSSGYGLFNQYHVSAINQALHYVIRNYQLRLSFYANDLQDSTIIQINNWYHVAFVYDYRTLTQKIYLNGYLSANRTSSPYQGTSGSISIGKTEESSGFPNYFSGYIDNVLLVMRAKNSSEILDDATLVTYHSFDNGYYNDSGPLNLQVTVRNVTLINGRINQAINFNTNSSYYQVNGFVLLGISNQSYSIALWVSPSRIHGSILIHLSTTTNGQGWCVNLMGFSSNGEIIVTGWGSTQQQIIGPVLPANVWTHVVATYSLTNGLRLYVNGTFIGTTGSMSYVASNQVNILTLANYIQGIGGSCQSQSIVTSVYYGSIDEFRVYSRELNATDVYKLANP